MKSEQYWTKVIAPQLQRCIRCTRIPTNVPTDISKFDVFRDTLPLGTHIEELVLICEGLGIQHKVSDTRNILSILL